VHSEACALAPRAPPRPALELADIVRAHEADYRSTHAVTPEQSKVLHDATRCRTPALGGHVEVCAACGYRSEPSYNSCRNRHCPKCQSSAAYKWIEARTERVLPTHYFHVVFTLPAELRDLAMRNRRLVYDLIFRCASATLLELGEDPKRLGARLGVTMVLHTWARDLAFHPHVHAIVTGGGLALEGDPRWLALRDDFAFPVEVLGALFRGKLLAAISAAHARHELDLGEAPVDPEAFDRLRSRLYAKRWNVYAKRPFGGPEQVIKYLGRYTHRVGISNSRLVSMDARGVTFRTKNGQTVTLAGTVFLERFLQHVLPRRFVKIRHYGMLAPAHVNDDLDVARALLAKTRATAPTTISRDATPAKVCPVCGQPGLSRETLPAVAAQPEQRQRGPP
jgi:hypothetical protein